MDCPHCGHRDLPQGSRFCPYCTEPIATLPDDRDIPIAATEFFDFELRAWQRGEDLIQVLVHSSPAGDMRRPVDVRLDPEQLRDIRPMVDRFWRDGQGPSRGTRRAAIEAGQYLSQLLLPTPVFTRLVRSQERVAPHGLRIRLCLDQSLVDLPWEFLYWPDLADGDALAGFLVLNPQISLVRQAPTLAVLPAETHETRQRMVFAGAHQWTPEGRDWWQIDAVFQHLSQSLEDVRDLLCLDRVRAEEDSIIAGLGQPTSIFHYTGHVEVEDDRGYLVGDVHQQPGAGAKYERLYAETLGARLQRAGTRLAVFSACNSGRWPFVKPLLQAGLPALVGTQGLVSVQGASAFCQKLYASLALGLSLDEAVTWARLHLLEPDTSAFGETFEWGVFMVYMPAREAVLFPRPEERALRERQQQARRERWQTVIYVTQNIGTVAPGGRVVGLNQ